MSDETNVNLPEDPKDTDGEREEATEALSAAETELAMPKALIEELPLSPQKQKRVPLSVFLLSAIALVLAAVMITYTLCGAFWRRKLAEVQLSDATVGIEGDEYYGFELFQSFMDAFAFEGQDRDAMMAAALKAYVAATGDPYAEYYTAEEYLALQASTAGDSEGIGINVINTTVEINGVEWKSIRVINVMKDSPAQKHGLQVGDNILYVGVGENAESVHALGYDMALSRLKGPAGTTAEFTVYREGEPNPISFTIPRGKVTTTSVYFHQHASDPAVGVIKIAQFDLTTPTQFSEAMDGLIAQGCTRFVFDVRYNPGGDLLSIQGVLSYFLEEGDVVIRTKSAAGETSQSTVAPVTYEGSYAGCSVKAEDIGKYRTVGGAPLKAVILCNGSTASAAELFVATFRDYGLADTVGTTTFGKGSMQTIWNLAPYGYNGALKLTTAKYFSAKDEAGYDGKGISPTVTEELSAEAAEYNIYELPDALDNQLAKALEQLNH